MSATPSPAASPAPAPREALASLVERVTFHSAESGFCVLRVRARGHREPVAVVGPAASVAAGEWVTASGEWVQDRVHGLQFRAAFLRTAAPTSSEGIERYRASGLVRGVGPVYARALVAAFGERVFEVVEAAPGRLREVILPHRDGAGSLALVPAVIAWTLGLASCYSEEWSCLD